MEHELGNPMLWLEQACYGQASHGSTVLWYNPQQRMSTTHLAERSNTSMSYGVGHPARVDTTITTWVWFSNAMIEHEHELETDSMCLSMVQGKRVMPGWLPYLPYPWSFLSWSCLDALCATGAAYPFMCKLATWPYPKMPMSWTCLQWGWRT